MPDTATPRVRVILRWIQIKDTLEPFFKEHGEFQFGSRITTGDQVVETSFPEEGHWEISDHPRFSKVDKIDKVLFEGEPGSTMLVELFGKELDDLSSDDPLDEYRKEFDGPAAGWIGRYAPGDEGPPDPENMKLWRVCYDVEYA